ncbi:MAG: hypothetical protein GX754_00715 [Clostridiaceae bacterium]|nr:hypothetical protein [Clostridiaceae bacterium]
MHYTQEAFTIDELEQILEAFTKGDPDNDGKDNTFGISACDDIVYSWNTVMGSFGYAYRYNINVEGKLYEWCIAPQHREFLKLANKWFKNGWLDPEFVTLNRTKMWEKITAGIIGYWNDPFNYVDPTSEGLKKRPPMSIPQYNSNAKILIATGEIGKDGKRGVGQWTAGGEFNDNFFINKNVDDEKLIRILRIFDYINLDSEGVILSNWGEEGVHFKWSGEAHKSPPIRLDGMGSKQGFGFYNLDILTDENVKYNYTEVPLKIYQWASTEGLKYVIKPYRWDFFNETKYADVNSKYGSGLQTIWKEFFYKAIVGEVNINDDAVWDAYVQKWLKEGGAELLAELEKAPVVEELSKK